MLPLSRLHLFLYLLIFNINKFNICSLQKSNVWIISLSSGIDNSIASGGVDALKSDTKSTIVKSVSCPIADTTGISKLKTTLAKFSLLKHLYLTKQFF